MGALNPHFESKTLYFARNPPTILLYHSNHDPIRPRRERERA